MHGRPTPFFAILLLVDHRRQTKSFVNGKLLATCRCTGGIDDASYRNFRARDVRVSSFRAVASSFADTLLYSCISTIDGHSGRPARPGPGPSPGWPVLSRAVPSPAQYRSGPCRASPRALPAAQARARGPVSCRASPRSPVYLSGSGLLRPTMGRAAAPVLSRGSGDGGGGEATATERPK